jgi:hypothetical protein
MLGMAEEFEVKWKLEQLLKREGISLHRLHQEIKEWVPRSSLYRYYGHQPKQVPLELLGFILWGLERIKGRRFQVADVLKYRSRSRENCPQE